VTCLKVANDFNGYRAIIRFDYTYAFAFQTYPNKFTQAVIIFHYQYLVNMRHHGHPLRPPRPDGY